MTPTRKYNSSLPDPTESGFVSEQVQKSVKETEKTDNTRISFSERRQKSSVNQSNERQYREARMGHINSCQR